MSAVTISNPWERAAQRMKAERLAAHLHAAGVSVEEIPSIRQEFWQALAKSLGLHPPSTATIILVIELVGELDAAKTRCEVSR